MTARPIDPATIDPELKRIMAKGALHLVKRQQPTPYERKALNHPDVVRATKLAEQATELADDLAAFARKAVEASALASRTAAEMRQAARMAYRQELKRPRTQEEIAADEARLLEQLKASTERNDTKET